MVLILERHIFFISAGLEIQIYLNPAPNDSISDIPSPTPNNSSDTDAQPGLGTAIDIL